MGEPMTVPWPEDHPTMPLRDVADVFGVSHKTAYRAVAAGTFPIAVIRVSNRIVVPTHEVRRLLQLPLTKPPRAKTKASAA